MGLHPNLHTWIPTSDADILLETRVYLPPGLSASSNLGTSSTSGSSDTTSPSSLNTSYRSHPVLLSQLPLAELDSLKTCGIKRIITAAHPWAKLGGNMLDPVISQHLVNAIYRPAESSASEPMPTALITYNARGVGKSTGSLGIFGLNTRPGEKDFADVEKWALEFFEGVEDVRRVGYSWGCVACLNAPLPPIPIPSILLISPPTTIFRLSTILASSTFNNALKRHLGQRRVWLIHGTEDQFTSNTTYVSIPSQVERRVVHGADHFFRTEEAGIGLEGYMREWLAMPGASQGGYVL